MREKNTTNTELLVTDDPAVEVTVRKVARRKGHALQHLRSSREAIGFVFDACARESVAIVDLDTSAGARRLLTTVSGLFPVIAVAEAGNPWVAWMVRHRRIAATLSKPVSSEALEAALDGIRKDAV